MAHSTDDASTTRIGNLLTCSICLEMFNDPRTLPCFHTFCRTCLEKFVKSQRDKAVSKETEEFNCPTCRSVFSLKSNEDVGEMNSSHFIRNMLDVVSVERRAKIAKCTSCDTEEATCRCVTCELFMCQKCLGTHESWPAFKKHTVLLISELTEGSAENQAELRGRLLCKKHTNKTLKFFCVTCKELVCRYCMDFDHMKLNHSCLLAEEVVSNKRQALKRSFDVLEKNLRKGSEALKALSNDKQRLKDNVETAKHEVNEHKQDLLQAFAQKLDKKAQVMIKKLDHEYNKTYDSLTKQTAAIELHLEKLKVSMYLSKNLLENGNQENIISSLNLIDDVEMMKKECLKQVQPEPFGNILFEKQPVKDDDFATIVGSRFGKVVNYTSSSLRQLSIILRDEEEYVCQMEEWLNELCQWHLCYRATRDGWSAKAFHSCCNNKKPTVILVKVRDYIFGGYTDMSWAGSSFKKSTSSFLFSLRNKDNLPPFKAPVKKKSSQAIYRSPSCGPTFGCSDPGKVPKSGSKHDLYICDNPHTNPQSHTNFGSCYQPPAGYSYEMEETKSLLAGSFEFIPTEIEVFY